ncbi:MAG: L,D-transpeptidase [Eubacteriales bacterium]
MKNKKSSIFIIIVLSVVLLGGTFTSNSLFDGNVVYAEDTDSAAPVQGEAGGYKYTVIEHYDDQWPAEIPLDLRYEKLSDYPAWPHYVVNIDGNRQRVYQAPSLDAKGIDSLFYGERCKVLELIETEFGERWYIFVTKVEGQDYVAYIPVESVVKREIRLAEMDRHVEILAGLGSMGPVVYVENYKHVNGIPPELKSGEYYDPWGNRRGQSAPGYFEMSLSSEFRYIPDGTLCILEEIVDITDIEESNIVFNSMGEYLPSTGGAGSINSTSHSPESIKKALDDYNASSTPFMSKVYVPSFGVSLWVESIYIDMSKAMQGGFGQAIVVDRKNQNIAVYEYDNGWKVISISYSTTGKSSETAVPTPLGYFMALEKKDIFEYEGEDSGDIEGFAPYAIRFSGGGYLHGVPMTYNFDEYGKKKPVYNYTESILSIGTVPESHMCIRNFTSHAKFMYDWAALGSCAVIVFE